MLKFIHCFVACVTGLIGLLVSNVAMAGNWGVAPITLEFDRATKTGLITVNNDDTKPVSFQIKLHKWTQDAQGQDKYEESGDLIYFPQILSIEPDQKKLIRIGVKRPAESSEQAYRLFIEELPALAGETTGKTGASVNVLIRFGVPIFLTPPGAASMPIFSTYSVSDGNLKFVVANTGNRRVRFQEMTLTAGTQALGKSDGWYVLPGARREFAIPVKQPLCGTDQMLKISTTVDDKEFVRTLTTKEIACTP